MDLYNVCYIDTEGKGKINGVSTFKNQLSEIFRESEQIKYSILYIRDSFNVKEDVYKSLKHLDNCVFFVNSWPASAMVEDVRSHIDNCRIIHIIHDLPWLTFFAGDTEGFLKSAKSGFSDFDSEEKKILYYSTIDSIKALRLCDDVVCLCEDSVKVVNECYDVPLRKIHLIRNGLVDFYNAENKGLSDTHIDSRIFDKRYYNLLFVGRPTYSKGWDRVVDLGRMIKENDFPMRIINVGTRQYNESCLNELSDIIINTGELTRTEIHKAFIESDAVFIPSRHEQCSYVGIEAMMHSKNIFTFGGYGLDNMFNEKNANVIKDLRQISPDAASFGKKARESYESLYGMEKMRQSYMDLIVS